MMGASRGSATDHGYTNMLHVLLLMRLCKNFLPLYDGCFKGSYSSGSYRRRGAGNGMLLSGAARIPIAAFGGHRAPFGASDGLVDLRQDRPGRQQHKYRHP